MSNFDIKLLKIMIKLFKIELISDSYCVADKTPETDSPNCDRTSW